MLPAHQSCGPPTATGATFFDFVSPGIYTIGAELQGFRKVDQRNVRVAQRFLFMSGGYRVPLAPDGLSVTGAATKVDNGWAYPADWVVESFSQEGPKMVRRGGCYYMLLAEGGTAGSPTGHMVVAARSRSIDGPWEDSPYNPVVRTTSATDRWWSKGHGSLVEGPRGQWYLVYHAYENGFYTLGRQTLIEPVRWTDDGWFRPEPADASNAWPERDGGVVADLSDDFSTSRMGTQWSFYKGAVADQGRVRYVTARWSWQPRGRRPPTVRRSAS